MKTVQRLFLLVISLAVTTSLYSCEDSNDPIDEIEDKIVPNETYLHFRVGDSGEENKKLVLIAATSAFQAEPDETWVKVEKGEEQIYVYVTDEFESQTQQNREATITLTSGKAKETITVKQDSYFTDYKIYMEETSMTFGYSDRLTQTLEVVCVSDVTVSYDEDELDWVVSAAVENGLLTVEVDSNRSLHLEDERKGEITLSAPNTESKTVTLEQEFRDITGSYNYKFFDIAFEEMTEGTLTLTYNGETRSYWVEEYVGMEEGDISEMYDLHLEFLVDDEGRMYYENRRELEARNGLPDTKTIIAFLDVNVFDGFTILSDVGYKYYFDIDDDYEKFVLHGPVEYGEKEYPNVLIGWMTSYGLGGGTMLDMIVDLEFSRAE